jgi:hypothetical protein
LLSLVRNLPTSSMKRPNPTPARNEPTGLTVVPLNDSSIITPTARSSPPHSTCAICRPPPPICGYPASASAARVISTVATATAMNSIR